MITISIDEAGVFDAGHSAKDTDSKTNLIGGVFFDDKNQLNEVTVERDRIVSYYREVINEVNKKLLEDGRSAKFPENLHWNSDASYDVNALVQPVKQQVSESLPEFLTNGTFGGNKLKDKRGNEFPERKGQYYICSIVKSSRGKEALLHKGLGIFFRDDKASNCYTHMMSDLTNHLIFNNPIFPDEGTYSIIFASRQTGEIEGSHYGEYENYGYKEKERDSNEKRETSNKFYEVLNKDTLRTLISEQYLSSETKDLQIETFRVPSITYRHGSENRNAWLYLADSVCGYLSFQIGNNDVLEVERRAEQLCPDIENLIFAYDDTDIKLSRAIRCYKDGDYYGALNNTYWIKQQDDDVSHFYVTKWVKYIETSIIEKSNGRLLRSALEKIRLMSNTVEANREYEIFRILETAVLHDRNIDDDLLLFKLNNTGMTLFCHRGDTKRAREYFERCEQYKNAVNFEEYTSCRNRYATAIIDSFKYDEAIAVAEETANALKHLIEASDRAFGKDKTSFGRKELGKTYSLLGQAFSYMGAPEHEVYFERSLEILNPFIADSLITKSYYIHSAIMNNDDKHYYKLMAEYTDGRQNAVEQLEYLFEESCRNNPKYNLQYGFFLMIKGIYTFEIEDTWKECWDNTVEIEEYNNRGMKKIDHPWEIIYKYLIMMAHRIGDQKREKLYRRRFDNFINKFEGDNLVRCITKCSRADICEFDGETEAAGMLFKELYHEMMTMYGDDFSTKKNPCAEDMKNIIKDKLKYMYC